MPADVRLPFFAYGLFEPGQLGWLRLRPFVDRVDDDAEVGGHLLERDGLVIVDRTGAGTVPGTVIFFSEQQAEDAYASIDALEPRKHYKWATTDALVSGETVRVNVLYGRSPSKGSVPLEGVWDGRADPLFTDGLATVAALVEEAGDPDPSDLTGFFRLQAAYMLLTTAVERYATFRYGLHPDISITARLERVAEEPAFQASLKEHVGDRTDTIQRTDRPQDKETLDAGDPGGSMEYYYQLRSNIAHRGKAAIGDYGRLQKALVELLAIFENVLKEAFEEASDTAPG